VPLRDADDALSVNWCEMTTHAADTPTYNKNFIRVCKMNNALQTLITNCQLIPFLISMPYTEIGCQERVALLNGLIDEVGENEEHPLVTLLDMIGMVVSNDGQSHYPIPESTPQAVLVYLMEEHHTK